MSEVNCDTQEQGCVCLPRVRAISGKRGWSSEGSAQGHPTSCQKVTPHRGIQVLRQKTIFLMDLQGLQTTSIDRKLRCPYHHIRAKKISPKMKNHWLQMKPFLPYTSRCLRFSTWRRYAAAATVKCCSPPISAESERRRSEQTSVRAGLGPNPIEHEQ